MSETEEFLKSREIELDRKQIIEIYMALGGIPQYLRGVERGKSSAQIINDVCFAPNGLLFDEFDKLYQSLFGQFENHLHLIRALAKTFSGLNQNDWLDRAGLSSGGTSSQALEELLQAGFVSYVPTFGKKKVLGHYLLTDEYSLFYLTWMADRPKIGLGNVEADYWIKKQNSRTWTSWSGLAFESVCLKHVPQIKKALGISGVSTAASAWSYRPENKKQTRAQIDLVIDRADNCINLCEIKFCNSEFTIDKTYAQELARKKRLFLKKTGTKKSVFITMITTHGVNENVHYHSAVDNQLTLSDLF